MDVDSQLTQGEKKKGGTGAGYSNFGMTICCREVSPTILRDSEATVIVGGVV